MNETQMVTQEPMPTRETSQVAAPVRHGTEQASYDVSIEDNDERHADAPPLQRNYRLRVQVAWYAADARAEVSVLTRIDVRDNELAWLFKVQQQAQKMLSNAETQQDSLGAVIQAMSQWTRETFSIEA